MTHANGKPSMRRLILLACLLALTSGCGKSTKPDNKAAAGGGGSDTRPALTSESKPTDVAKDFLEGSGYKDVQIVSSEEKSATLFKKPAVALRAQWREGSGEPKESVFIIQGGRVEAFEPYDVAKSLDENASAAVQKREMP